jgi:hypothetical protein
VAVIEVEGLHKSYGDRVAVDDVGLDVQAGEIFGCWGRTGPARRPPWRSCRGCGGGTGGVYGCSGWTRGGTGTGCGGGSGRSCSRRRCLTGCGSGRRSGCSPVGGTGRPRWSGWGGAGGWRGCGGGRSPSCQGVSSSGCSSRWPWSTGPRWCSSMSQEGRRHPAGQLHLAGRERRLAVPARRGRAGHPPWRRRRGRRRRRPGRPGGRGPGHPRVAPDDFRTHHPDLEDVFLALTGRDLRA